jgi:hypothetical protein
LGWISLECGTGVDSRAYIAVTLVSEVSVPSSHWGCAPCPIRLHLSMTQSTQTELLARVGDRRRVPRYSCSGQAQISCFPSHGTLLRGRVRDLGLGGCCIESIETISPFDLGARTEILVEVNSWFFRAMGHVRAVRGRSAISMEFLRMSTGGYSMLADLIADLETPHAVTTDAARLVKHSRGLLRGESSPAAALTSRPNHRVAISGTILPPQSGEEISRVANHRAWIRDLYPAATSVDIFV